MSVVRANVIDVGPGQKIKPNRYPTLTGACEIVNCIVHMQSNLIDLMKTLLHGKSKRNVSTIIHASNGSEKCTCTVQPGTGTEIETILTQYAQTKS